MPLFGKHNGSQAAPSTTHTPTTNPERRSGFFGRRQAAPSTTTNGVTTNKTSSRGGLLHRNEEDPSIAAARKQVSGAEAAERDADQALFRARAAVKEARQRVQILEREAAEE